MDGTKNKANTFVSYGAIFYRKLKKNRKMFKFKIHQNWYKLQTNATKFTEFI